jgi:hypothetical protein
MRQERHESKSLTRTRRGAPGRGLGLGLAAAALLGLAGCAAGGAGGGVVYFSNFTAGYVPSSLAANAPLLVETFGTPAPNLAQEAVTAATVDGLRRYGPPWMPRNFSGNPADVAGRNYVVRIAYGVPKAFKGREICGDEMSGAALEAARGQDDASASRTVAGVCRGSRAVAYAEGSPGSNADITSARFAEFVGLLGRKLMPRQNPVTRDDCLWRRCD